MAHLSEFASFLAEQFQGSVDFKRMFGGYGLFRDRLMIGLIAEDTLYLKSDPISDLDFDKFEMPRFAYQKGEKLVQMSFRQCPPDALEDPEALDLWLQVAHQAALRAKKA